MPDTLRHFKPAARRPATTAAFFEGGHAVDVRPM
jgi:hypothetical protein